MRHRDVVLSNSWFAVQIGLWPARNWRKRAPPIVRVRTVFQGRIQRGEYNVEKYE